MKKKEVDLIMKLANAPCFISKKEAKTLESLYTADIPGLRIKRISITTTFYEELQQVEEFEYEVSIQSWYEFVMSGFIDKDC